MWTLSLTRNTRCVGRYASEDCISQRRRAQCFDTTLQAIEITSSIQSPLPVDRVSVLVDGCTFIAPEDEWEVDSTAISFRGQLSPQEFWGCQKADGISTTPFPQPFRIPSLMLQNSDFSGNFVSTIPLPRIIDSTSSHIDISNIMSLVMILPNRTTFLRYHSSTVQTIWISMGTSFWVASFAHFLRTWVVVRFRLPLPLAPSYFVALNPGNNVATPSLLLPYPPFVLHRPRLLAFLPP